MKSTKVLFATLALAVLPSMSFAMCQGSKHQEAAMSCADGMVYDTDTRTCVTVSG